MPLAGLLCDAGRYGDFPERMIRLAMQIDAMHDGPDGGLTGMHLEMLARLLHGRGDYVGAEQLSRRAIAIAEKREGAESWTVSVRLNTLAGTFLEREDHAQAVRLYRRSLAIAEQIEGPHSDELLCVLENLVNALVLAGEASEAETYARRVVSIAESVAEPDRRAVGRYVRGLANVLATAGDYAGAVPARRRALAIADKELGAEHPVTLMCVVELAEALVELGSPKEEAEAAFRRAIAMAEKDPAAPDELHSRLCLGLGQLLTGQARHADAIPVLEREIARIEERADAGEGERIVIVLQELGIAYRETGSYEAAGR